ncbi:MAG TPA: hypothetical protein VGO34_07285 [Alphaproteobacteria bacterium]|jgi:hypothetical protein
MKMKILFWLHLLTAGPAMIFFQAPKSGSNAIAWFFFAVSLATFLGFFAVAYGKRIGEPYIWRCVFGIDAYQLSDALPAMFRAFYRVFMASPEAAASMPLFLAICALATLLIAWFYVPPIVALFIYAFRRESLWNPPPRFIPFS